MTEHINSEIQRTECGLSPAAVVLSLFLILAAFIFLTIAQMSIVPAMNEIKKSMALTPSQFAFLKTGTSVCFALGILAGGFVPVSKRCPLIIGITMIIISVLVAATGFCRFFDSLILVRFAVGACCGLLTTPLVILGFNLVSQKFWHTWFALKSVALIVGGAIAFIFSGIILSKTNGLWQQVYFILGPLGVTVSLLTFFIKMPSHTADSSLSLNVVKFTDYLHSKQFLIVMGSGIMAACCLGVLNEGMSKIILPPSSSASVTQATPIIASSAIIIFVAVIASAIVSDAVRNKNITGVYNIISICLACSAISFLFFISSTQIIFVYVFMLCFNFLVIPLTVLIVSVVRDQHKAPIYGMYSGGLLLIGLTISGLMAPIITNLLFLFGITILTSISVIGFFVAGRTHQKILMENTLMHIQCPECRSTVDNIPTHWLGKKVKCDTCNCIYTLTSEQSI